MNTALVHRARYIPWLFVAGFAVVIAVNATMIWFAVGSFSGLYADHPRETGLHYNQVLAEQKVRDALGWNISAGWRAEIKRLDIIVTGPDGRPLDGALASARLVRPAEKRPPLPVALGLVADGQFAAYIDLPERGNWDLDLEIERNGQHYAVTRRMFLK
jgi:nitrogen fixation protein FixH